MPWAHPIFTHYPRLITQTVWARDVAAQIGASTQNTSPSPFSGLSRTTNFGGKPLGPLLIFPPPSGKEETPPIHFSSTSLQLVQKKGEKEKTQTRGFNGCVRRLLRRREGGARREHLPRLPQKVPLFLTLQIFVLIRAILTH